MKKLLIFCLLALFVFDVHSQDSENINLLASWNDTTIRARNPSKRYNEVWGYAKDGREYGIIGSVWGTHIIDVTDPNNIYQVDSVKGGFSNDWVIHRDYKDYNGYLYAVCDEGWAPWQSTLQIMDMSYLPDSVHVVYDKNEFFITSHNLFIDTGNAKMYACLGDKIGIYSLDDPEKPSLLGEYNLGHIHDLYVRNDTAFLNCGPEGLKIVDFSDLDTVTVFDVISEKRDPGYNHNGWLSKDGKTYVYAEETIGRTVKVCDVSDISQIEVKSTIHAGTREETLAHNVCIKNGVAFISYYVAGLQVFDITNTNIPYRVGFYDIDGESEGIGFGGAWGVYPYLPSGNILVSDRGYGLLLFDVSEAFVGVKSVNNNKSVQVSPNPFESNLKVDFKVDKNQKVKISLFDVQGREIKTLMDSYLLTGEHSLDFNMLDVNLDSKVYFLRISMDQSVITKKVIKL